MNTDDQNSTDNQNSDGQYSDGQLEHALRTLDPADRHIDPFGSRPAADLEEILATDPGTRSGPGANTGSGLGRSAGGATGSPRRHPLRRPLHTPVRRAALVGASAAALAVGLVAVPALTTDNEDAFASWATVPEQLAPQQAPAAASECRATWQNGPDLAVMGVTSEQLDSAHVAVAEKRGAWTTVVLAGDDGLTATCTWGPRGPASDGLGTRDILPLDPREVRMFNVGGSSGKAQGDLSSIIGYSGDDVVGVTYHSERYGDVVATVGEERFALWMLGDELHGDARTDGVDVEVTYADDTTETVRLAY